MGEASLYDDELKGVSKSLTTNESPGHDSISMNVLKETSYINLLLQQGIFPGNLKIARGSQIFKADNNFLLTTCRPISVLTCFSKLLAWTYKVQLSLFKYFSENSILREKQFGFQTARNTEDTTLYFVNKLSQSFDDNSSC